MAGAFYLQLGFATIQGALYGFLLSFVFLVLYMIEENLEGRFLLEPQFGDEYRAYRKRVKGFIPFVFWGSPVRARRPGVRGRLSRSRDRV